MKIEELKAAVALISYKDCKFTILEESGQFFLQVSYPVVDERRTAFARKWLINADYTRSQLVATAFKAVLTVEEHEARENFTFRGEAVFHPHHDVETLVAIRKLARANIAFGGDKSGIPPEDVDGGSLVRKTVSAGLPL